MTEELRRCSKLSWAFCDGNCEKCVATATTQTMTDVISRQAAIDAVEKESQVDGAYGYMDTKSIVDLLNDLPSAQPEDWMAQNKDRILKAGMKGQEVEFRIGGRLFAIREKAQ